MSYTDLEDDEDFSQLDRGNDFESTEDEDEIIEDEESEEEENIDPEEDQESDDEEEEVEEVEEEEEEKPKDIRIPKKRLDKALRQRDEMRDRAAWLEEQLEKLIEKETRRTQVQEQVPQEPEYDFDTAEESYANLLIEGETAKAAKLRREIDQERQKEIKRLINQIKSESLQEASIKSAAAIEEEKFQTRIANYENKYPFLDSEADEYNEEAIETVNTLMSGYIAKGASKSEALRKAVEKVIPFYEKEVKKEVTKQKSIGQVRKEEAGKKAAQASKSQPTKTKSSSSTQIDSTKLDVKKMSDKDFAKLTPRELKLLRGD